jgi:hypothetical protein
MRVTKLEPDQSTAIRKTALSQRLKQVSFLLALAIAVIGWFAAIGWATVAFANWIMG